MRLTRSSAVLAVVGVLLLVAAGLVRFVYLPTASKLPSNLDITQSYSGTYTGLNPAALAGSTAGGLQLSDAPVTASRRYQTTSVDGNTAIVGRTLTESVAGQAKPASTIRYAVDRTDFQSTSAPSGAKDVVPSQGAIFTLPLHPSTADSYKLWDEATAKAFPLVAKGTATVAGRDTLRYQSVAEGPLADPTAMGLPASVTKAQLAALAPALAAALPAQFQAQLPQILASLPDPAPLSWTSSTDATVSFDATTGAPIRVQSTQKIGAAIAGVPITVPFATIALTTTGASEKTIADDAASNAGKLTLVGTTIPIVLLVLGVLVLVIAIVLAVRTGRRPGAAPTPGTGVKEPARV